MIEPIPRPLVLDPDREKSDDRDLTLEEHRARADRLHDALKETCGYAQQLWDDVARARQYLYDSLPPDPRDPEADRKGTTPTGPDDEAGWQRWADAYAELTSILAGPHGDSGMGASEARQASQLRRDVPPGAASTGHEPHAAVTPPAEPAQPAQQPSAEHSPAAQQQAEPTTTTPTPPSATAAPPANSGAPASPARRVSDRIDARSGVFGAVLGFAVHAVLSRRRAADQDAT